MNYEELTKEQLISIHKDTLLYLGEVSKEYEDLEKELERLNNKIAELEQENAVLKTQVVNKDTYSYGIR